MGILGCLSGNILSVDRIVWVNCVNGHGNVPVVSVKSVPVMLIFQPVVITSLLQLYYNCL